MSQSTSPLLAGRKCDCEPVRVSELGQASVSGPVLAAEGSVTAWLHWQGVRASCRAMQRFLQTLFCCFSPGVEGNRPTPHLPSVQTLHKRHLATALQPTELLTCLASHTVEA